MDRVSPFYRQLNANPEPGAQQEVSKDAVAVLALRDT